MILTLVSLVKDDPLDAPRNLDVLLLMGTPFILGGNGIKKQFGLSNWAAESTLSINQFVDWHKNDLQLFGL